jgi:hypothetical protein
MRRPPAPPKKRKSRKKKAKKKAPISVATSVVVLDKSALTRMAIFRAYHVYMRNPGMGVRQVWTTGVMSEDEGATYIRDCCSLAYVMKVAQKDKWRSRRQEFWQDIRAAVMEHAQTELVQREIEEMVSLELASAIAMKHIQGDDKAGIEAVKPKSLEGAIGALVQLDKRMGEKRRVIANDAADAAARIETATDTVGGGAMPLIEDGYTDADIAAMAKAVATKRAGIEDAE